MPRGALPSWDPPDFAKPHAFTGDLTADFPGASGVALRARSSGPSFGPADRTGVAAGLLGPAERRTGHTGRRHAPRAQRAAGRRAGPCLGEPARDRGADRRRAEEDDRVERHHAAASADRAELQGRVDAGREGDAGRAERDQRSDLARPGWARPPRPFGAPNSVAATDEQPRRDTPACP